MFMARTRITRAFDSVGVWPRSDWSWQIPLLAQPSYDDFARPLHDAYQLEERAHGRRPVWLQQASPV